MSIISPPSQDTDEDGTYDNLDSCPANAPVRIISGGNYNTLQSAYDNALDGSTIQSHEITLTGDLNINRN